MKRFFIMALIAVCSVQMASAIDVWVSTGSSATKYHKTKECPGLNNTMATIKKVTESEAKKSTPARDANGRFVKKTAE